MISRMLKSLTSLFLSLLILISSTGVSGQIHDCSVKGRLFGLFGSQVSCCSILKLKPKRAHGTCCKVKKFDQPVIRRVPCCQDHIKFQRLDIQHADMEPTGSLSACSRPVGIANLPVQSESRRLNLLRSFIHCLEHPPPLSIDAQSKYGQFRC